MARHNSSDTGESPVRLARRLASDGQVSDATRILDARLVDFPDDAEVLIARATIHEQIDEHDRALRDFDAAVRSQPESSWARLQRARYFWRAGREHEADDEFDYVTRELAPHVAEYHFEYARFLVDRKCFGVAIDYLAKAIRLAPGMQQAYVTRATLSQGFGRNDDTATDLYQYLCLESQRVRPLGGPDLRPYVHEIIRALWKTPASLDAFNAAQSDLSAGGDLFHFAGSEYFTATVPLTWASNVSTQTLVRQPTVKEFFRRVHCLLSGESGSRPAGCANRQLSDGTLLQTVPQKLWAFVYLLSALSYDEDGVRLDSTHGDLLRNLTTPEVKDSSSLSALMSQ